MFLVFHCFYSLAWQSQCARLQIALLKRMSLWKKADEIENRISPSQLAWLTLPRLPFCEYAPASLLLCRDANTAHLASRAFKELGIEVEHFVEREMALRNLRSQRFDAIVVDDAVSGAPRSPRLPRSSLFMQGSITPHQHKRKDCILQHWHGVTQQCGCRCLRGRIGNSPETCCVQDAFAIDFANVLTPNDWEKSLVGLLEATSSPPQDGSRRRC